MFIWRKAFRFDEIWMENILKFRLQWVHFDETLLGGCSWDTSKLFWKAWRDLNLQVYIEISWKLFHSKSPLSITFFFEGSELRGNSCDLNLFFFRRGMELFKPQNYVEQLKFYFQKPELRGRSCNRSLFPSKGAGNFSNSSQPADDLQSKST